jgi:undecaprenyl-diphosphatase
MRPKKHLKEVARSLLAADEHAYRALEPYSQGLPLRIVSGVGDLGDQPQLRVFAGVTGLVGALSGDQRLLRAAVRMIVAHEAATLLKDIVKRRVDRHRPKKAKRRQDRKLKNGTHTQHDLTSFPSGHSAGAVATARAFSREFPEHTAPALAGAGSVAMAQVPKCTHYVTDVFAGLMVGLVAESAVNVLLLYPPKHNEGMPAGKAA